MAKHEQEDLPHVAEFVAVMTNVAALRSSLHDSVIEHLRQTYPDVAGDGLGGVLRSAWQSQRGDDPTDATVLAQMPCPIYVAAHPWDLLAEALRKAGKDPVVDLCRWRPDCTPGPSRCSRSSAITSRRRNGGSCSTSSVPSRCRIRSCSPRTTTSTSWPP